MLFKFLTDRRLKMEREMNCSSKDINVIPKLKKRWSLKEDRLSYLMKNADSTGEDLSLNTNPKIVEKLQSLSNAELKDSCGEINVNSEMTSTDWITNNYRTLIQERLTVYNLNSSIVKQYHNENVSQSEVKDKVNSLLCTIRQKDSEPRYIISDDIEYNSDDDCENDSLPWVNKLDNVKVENCEEMNEVEDGENCYQEINTLPVMCILNGSDDENEDVSSGDVNNVVEELIGDKILGKTQENVSGNEENKEISSFENVDKVQIKGRPHACSYCKKTFTHLNHKKQHERTHTGEKPFSCNYCGKTFSQMSSRDRHEKVHTGEKPYLCSYCGKLFNSVGNKNKHEKIHTGERPYSCKFCGKPFISRDKKDHHEKTHSGEKPHTCSFCEKSFTTARGKQEHETIHLGKKLYSCRHCKKSFNSASNKSKHERRHFGKLPFFCQLCNKSFPWPANKNSHKLECSARIIVNKNE